MPQPLAAAGVGIFEQDVAVLGCIGRYFWGVVDEDALTGIGPVGVGRAEGLEQPMGCGTSRTFAQCRECGIGGEPVGGHSTSQQLLLDGMVPTPHEDIVPLDELHERGEVMAHLADVAGGDEVLVAVGQGEVVLGVEYSKSFHDAKVQKSANLHNGTSQLNSKYS